MEPCSPNCSAAIGCGPRLQRFSKAIKWWRCLSRITSYNVCYTKLLRFNIAPIYYNKDLFEKNGLSVPTTYEEFKNVVTTLSAKGIAPIALGNKDRWTGSLWYMYLADRIAGQKTLADTISGSASFTDPGLVQAAQEVQWLVDNNAFIKGFNGQSNEEAKSEFLNEKAAMYLMGSYNFV